MEIFGKSFTGDAHDTKWADKAACASIPPDQLFDSAVEQRYVVKSVCRRIEDECPVQAPCLVAALRTGDQAGVWGGLTERERNKIGGSLLQLLDAEEAMQKADRIHRNTHPELYARISPEEGSFLELLPEADEQAS